MLLNEVVKWIRENSTLHEMPHLDYECEWLDGQRSFYDDDWQAFLKKIGVELGQENS